MKISIVEYIKVQLTLENISYVKSISSFAKVINYLIQEMREDKELEAKILTKINS